MKDKLITIIKHPLKIAIKETGTNFMNLTIQNAINEVPSGINFFFYRRRKYKRLPPFLYCYLGS